MPSATEIERCLAAGGVVLFGADTVYGLAWSPGSDAARRRVYRGKGREEAKPAAEMWFSVDAALATIEAGPALEEVLRRLLPGPITAVLPGGRGLRVPELPDGSPLAELRRPVVQTSANLSGGPEARRLSDVPREIRAVADLTVDAGELPGVASTVVDLRDYEESGAWEVLREGAVPRREVEWRIAHGMRA